MAIRAKVLKSWETTITFFSCTFGFILGLPMTTEVFPLNTKVFLGLTVFVSDGNLCGVSSGYLRWRNLVDRPNLRPTNHRSFHGPWKTLQWRHGRHGTFFFNFQYLRLEPACSNALLHLERHSSSSTHGKSTSIRILQNLQNLFCSRRSAWLSLGLEIIGSYSCGIISLTWTIGQSGSGKSDPWSSYCLSCVFQLLHWSKATDTSIMDLTTFWR